MAPVEVAALSASRPRLLLAHPGVAAGRDVLRDDLIELVGLRLASSVLPRL
jgi:hypothetical protein